MKKLAYALFVTASMLGAATEAFAQPVATCSATAPATQVGISSIRVGGTIWTTPPPMQTTAVGLTHTQFLITKRGRKAMTTPGGTTPDTTGGGGDVILGTSADGITNPGWPTLQRYGVRINAGDTFDLTAVGYNRQQIKDLANDIFTGSSGGQTCCQIINSLNPGFCDSLNRSGYTSSAQVNELSDMIALFDAFSEKELSVAGLISSMQTINGYSTQALFPPACGKSRLPICFGIDKSAKYGYIASNTVAVEELSKNTCFVVFPNPSELGFVNVVIDSKSESDVRLSVYNTVGEQVQTQVLNGLNGQTTLQVSTSGLTAGVYFIELMEGQNRQTRKLIVR